MQSYVVASDVSTDMGDKCEQTCRQTRAIGDAPCESEMQSYEVASDVSTDTGDQ